ncbi:MAG TPA: hypothetical protein VMU41_15595 [Candidatus Binataceae bacterium]|nr:hypothetical protein [Candidatus Binataceae bacterium]
MKRIVIGGLAAIVIFATPIVSYAQQQWGQGDLDMEYDAQGPPPYNDVENGQVLQIASYLVMPVGWLLEHGVTRPLHDLATNSAAAPILSGDTEIKNFGESSNANLLPPDTFRPFQMPANPTQMDTGAGPLVTANTNSESPILPPVTYGQTVATQTTTTTIANPYPNTTRQAVIH